MLFESSEEGTKKGGKPERTPMSQRASKGSLEVQGQQEVLPVVQPG